tara:strand:- start:482 stop:1447 length:966 start_codon:yes stop_codon:yes gene_type:complete
MYSSYKKDKKLFENWRRYIKEEQEKDNLTDFLNLPLASFVQKMNSMQKETLSSIFSGLKDGAAEDDSVTITETTVKASVLRPTQSEVVFGKSIPFALQRPEMFMQYYSSNGPFKVGPPNNNAIVTFKGKFILDGHHRWSSLYCVNPDASLATFDISAPVSPLTALKLMQASIKHYIGAKKIPSNKGGGINLFTINQDTLFAEVENYMTPELAQKYMELGLMDALKEDIETGREQRRIRNPDREQTGMITSVTQTLQGIYLENVNRMQSKNKPVKGATPRPPMPQTDKPAGSRVKAGGGTPAALEPLEQGVIDFRSPFNKDQ